MLIKNYKFSKICTANQIVCYWSCAIYKLITSKTHNNTRQIQKYVIRMVLKPITSKTTHNNIGIGAMVKVVDSHPCWWGSIPGNSCSLLIVSLSKGLSLYFMCSDQHVKYQMPRVFSLTSSLLLDYHVKRHTHTHMASHPTTLWDLLLERL